MLTACGSWTSTLDCLYSVLSPRSSTLAHWCPVTQYCMGLGNGLPPFWCLAIGTINNVYCLWWPSLEPPICSLSRVQIYPINNVTVYDENWLGNYIMKTYCVWIYQDQVRLISCVLDELYFHFDKIILFYKLICTQHWCKICGSIEFTTRYSEHCCWFLLPGQMICHFTLKAGHSPFIYRHLHELPIGVCWHHFVTKLCSPLHQGIACHQSGTKPLPDLNIYSQTVKTGLAIGPEVK